MQVMDRAEVIQWRKAERQRLIAERLAIPGDIRRHYAGPNSRQPRRADCRGPRAGYRCLLALSW